MFKNITVRRASYKDKETLRTFIRKTDVYHYNNCPTFKNEVDRGLKEHYKQSDTLIDRVNIGDFYLIESFNVPIGTVMVWNNKGETTLTNFFIEDKYRGKGYGKYFLRKIINEITTDYCVLAVFEENKKSLEFYYLFGFYYLQTEKTSSGNLLWLRYDKLKEEK